LKKRSTKLLIDSAAVYPGSASYTKPRRGRTALIILGVVFLHIVVIGAVAAWPGSGVRSIFAGEIHVTIVPSAKPVKASAQ
jgi:hypothetical protein